MTSGIKVISEMRTGVEHPLALKAFVGVNGFAMIVEPTLSAKVLFAHIAANRVVLLDMVVNSFLRPESIRAGRTWEIVHSVRVLLQCLPTGEDPIVVAVIALPSLAMSAIRTKVIFEVFGGIEFCGAAIVTSGGAHPDGDLER